MQRRNTRGRLGLPTFPLHTVPETPPPPPQTQHGTDNEEDDEDDGVDASQEDSSPIKSYQTPMPPPLSPPPRSPSASASASYSTPGKATHDHEDPPLASYQTPVGSPAACGNRKRGKQPMTPRAHATQSPTSSPTPPIPVTTAGGPAEVVADGDAGTTHKGKGKSTRKPKAKAKAKGSSKANVAKPAKRAAAEGTFPLVLITIFHSHTLLSQSRATQWVVRPLGKATPHFLQIHACSDR